MGSDFSEISRFPDLLRFDGGVLGPFNQARPNWWHRLPLP